MWGHGSRADTCPTSLLSYSLLAGMGFPKTEAVQTHVGFSTRAWARVASGKDPDERFGVTRGDREKSV